MISVIFSTFNEVELGFFEKSLQSLSKKSFIEIIVVDKGSTDGTQELAKKYNCKLIESSSNSRGYRLNEGISHSNAELVIFNHPRSIISDDGLNYIINNYKELTWGGFTHKFDIQSPLLNFTSWYSNHVRADIREIFYLDHCIFCKRSLLDKIGGFPIQEIFEDTILSLKLRKVSASKRIPYSSTTSAIRFRKNGQFKQAILNQVLKIAFNLNFSPEKMNKVYELGLNLNSKY